MKSERASTAGALRHDIRTVEELLGHRDASTTINYSPRSQAYSLGERQPERGGWRARSMGGVQTPDVDLSS